MCVTYIRVCCVVSMMHPSPARLPPKRCLQQTSFLFPLVSVLQLEHQTSITVVLRQSLALPFSLLLSLFSSSDMDITSVRPAPMYRRAEQESIRKVRCPLLAAVYHCCCYTVDATGRPTIYTLSFCVSLSCTFGSLRGFFFVVVVRPDSSPLWYQLEQVERESWGHGVCQSIKWDASADWCDM